MKKYRLINNITGWLAFLIAAVTYLLTVEPTVSFWDCGEFIATAYRLQVGHPPGAPSFMILARIASLFASDPSQVALMVNGMSALASAFTILFLFWTITHLAKKLIVKAEEQISLSQLIVIIGAGLVGALAYTFSDTFWFSAIEGEVYAMSSFFTAIVFWAILKWEAAFGKPHADRWLVLIAYLIGFSIGVHLLNLLAIPAIVFVYYYKKYEVTNWGIAKALIVSILILVGIMYGIIPGLVVIGSKIELLFINAFGLPYNSGTIFYFLVLLGLLIFGIKRTYEKKLVLWNTVLACLTVLIIGYSSFAMIPIRSLANTPMDTNNPDNIISLIKYLNREQYGDRPLFKGHSYNATRVGQKYTKPVYIKKDGKYVVSHRKFKPTFDKKHTSLFPRMYSADAQHVREYNYWADLKPDNKDPISMRENLRFFFRYQLNQMYFRYFMWNFSGKQSNHYVSGQNDLMNANWITGIPFLDKVRFGNQNKLPSRVKNNVSRNKYYMFPLLLGIIGILFQLSMGSPGKRSLWIVFLLFIFTGVAIVVYLNQTPVQPRERDYAYAASFYAFTIWIGFGVLGIYNFLKNKMSGVISASVAAIISLLAVPVLMASENWDDHDRSGRWLAHDLAYNYLNTCEKNAIVFTYGDNDTFPLWYMQDVEGVRTDVRVCNLSYLAAGWYVKQMDRKAYKSEPMPFSMNPDQYREGVRDYVLLREHPSFKEKIEQEGGLNLHQAMIFLGSDDRRTQLPTQSGNRINYLPAKKFYIPVDKEKVLQNGTVSKENADKIVDKIPLSFSQNGLQKNTIMALDAIAGSNWDRPVYFAFTIGPGNMQNLTDYLQLEGFGYRVVPIQTKGRAGRIGRVNTEKMYDNYMNKFKWGGLDKPGVLFETTNGDFTIILGVKTSFLRLAESLFAEEKKEKAINVLDKFFEVFHPENIPLILYEGDNQSSIIAQLYYRLGENEKADALVEAIIEDQMEFIEYYFSLDAEFYELTKRKREIVLSTVASLSRMVGNYNKEFSDEIALKLQDLINQYDQPIKFK